MIEPMFHKASNKGGRPAECIGGYVADRSTAAVVHSLRSIDGGDDDRSAVASAVSSESRRLMARKPPLDHDHQLSQSAGSICLALSHLKGR
jgi:hypothetical protein